MAEKVNSQPDNVPGKYYVDDSCIDCDVCRQTAPDHFCHNEEDGYSYVCKQPDNEEEDDLCREAMESCPVEAIGDDGAE
jgi:ferredoxin